MLSKHFSFIHDGSINEIVSQIGGTECLLVTWLFVIVTFVPWLCFLPTSPLFPIRLFLHWTPDWIVLSSVFLSETSSTVVFGTHFETCI